MPTLSHLSSDPHRASLAAAGLFAAVLLAAMASAAWGAKVYVQDSPDAVKLLDHARDRLERDEPEEAVRLVQQVIDEHGTKLLEQAEGRFAEASRVAALMLADHPRLLEAYQTLYNPTAAKLLNAAGHDAAALAGLVDRYGMTGAGFDAGLRLAGLQLEAGRPEAAAVVLERLGDHPASTGGRGAWLELSAAAALLGGDGERYTELAARLQEDGHAEAAAALATMSQALDLPPVTRELSPLDALPAAAPPDPVDRPLWSMSVGGAEAYILRMQRGSRDRFDSLASDGQLLNTMTVVYGDRLYINSGERVYAVEPISGREVWQTPLSEVNEEVGRAGAQMLSQVMQRGADLSGIAADGERVVAISGLTSALAIYSPYMQNLGSSALVCLDAKTGRIAWSMEPGGVEDGLQMSSWYGRPLLWQDRVYATIRRRQRFNFQDAYLVCLDAKTGQTVWRRHLGSTAITEARLKPSMATMTLDAGWLYLDSGVGTVAKVSAGNGMVQWLVTHEVTDRPSGSLPNRPWVVSAPIVCEAGVVMFSEWDDAIRVYKPQTGELVDSMSATERWGGPLYIARSGRDILAVGLNTGLFDGKTLENKWRYRLGGSLRGRAAVTDGRIYLPTSNHVAVVDSATGKELATRQIEMPATLLALDGQLIAAQRHRVSAYTSWDIAVGHLSRQIEASPLDHRPLMAMAWLAYRHDRPERLLESLDRTMALSRTAPDSAQWTDELFEQVLSMATQDDRRDSGLRERLFDRLAAIADTPAEEVTYHLAMGQHLQNTQRTAEAIEHYQTVLGEAAYRQQLYRHDAGSRQAGVEAEQRVRALVDRHGREVYQAYDEQAERRLRELASQGDPQPLEDLAAAYPTSASAINALRVAAERAVERGEGARAVANLSRAAQLTRSPKELAFIVGRQAELMSAREDPSGAARVLRRLLMAHPQAMPLRSNVPTDPQQWLAELDAAARESRQRARLNVPLTGRGRTIGARLIAGPLESADGAGSPVLLFASAQSIEARRAGDLSVVWARPHEGAGASLRLIHADARRTCLLDEASGRLTTLDTATGRPLWEDANIERRLETIPLPVIPDDPNDPRWQIGQEPQQPRVVVRGGGGLVVINGRVIRGNLNVQEPEEPQVARPLLAAGEDTVVVADRQGRVFALSAERGGVRWQSATLVREAQMLHLWGDQLVIAGLDEQKTPLLCVYDARTGTLMHRITKPKLQPFRWAAMTGQGQLVFVGATEVESFDLVRGQTSWRAEPGVRLVVSPQSGAWLGEDRLIVRSEDNDLIVVNLLDGRIVGRRPVRGVIEGAMTMRQEYGQWVLAGDGRCESMDAEGQTRWVAALADPVQVTDVVLTERYVVLLATPVRLGAAGAEQSRRVYVLERASGVLRYTAAVEAEGALDRLSVVDGRLLLGGESFTAVLDGADQ